MWSENLMYVYTQPFFSLSLLSLFLHPGKHLFERNYVSLFLSSFFSSSHPFSTTHKETKNNVFFLFSLSHPSSCLYFSSLYKIFFPFSLFFCSCVCSSSPSSSPQQPNWCVLSLSLSFFSLVLTTQYAHAGPLQTFLNHFFLFSSASSASSCLPLTKEDMEREMRRWVCMCVAVCL